MKLQKPETNDFDAKVKHYAYFMAENSFEDWRKDKEQAIKRGLVVTGETFEEYRAKQIEQEAIRMAVYVGKVLKAIESKDTDYLKTSLHTGNKDSRKIFEVETGIKLGTSNKAMEEVVAIYCKGA